MEMVLLIVKEALLLVLKILVRAVHIHYHSLRLMPIQELHLSGHQKSAGNS
jgi:hypothetical protein